MRRWRFFGVIGVLLGVVSAEACDDDADTRYPGDADFLQAGLAQDQPRDPRDGVSIFVTAHGGNSLLVETEYGTHFAPGSAELTRSSCVNVPNANAQYILVKPDNAEAVVRLTLFNAPDASTCSGTAVRVLLLPVEAPASSPSDAASDVTDAGNDAATNEAGDDGSDAGSEEAASDSGLDGSDVAVDQ